MTIFQAKLLLILAALANALLLHRASAWTVHQSTEMQGTTPRLRLAGVLSIGCWLAAIFAGRMIGYLD